MAPRVQPFYPTFGVGAPGASAPVSQLYFDTTGGPPYQGYVYNYSLAAWEKFGGAGGGGFPTTENVNSTHAGVALGNKNVSYITTDGTGTVNNVTLPNPPVDVGAAESGLWTAQWHVVILKTRTNAADTVLVTVTTPSQIASDANCINAFNYHTDSHNKGQYLRPNYALSSLTLSAVGDALTFRWQAGAWFLDATGGNSDHLVSYPVAPIGMQGAYATAALPGQKISVQAGDSHTAQGAGSLQLFAGYAYSTGYAGNLNINGGNAYYGGNAGQLNINGGDSGYTLGSQAGHTQINSGVGRAGSHSNGGYLTIHSGLGDAGYRSGIVTLQSGDMTSSTNYSDTGSVTIKSGHTLNAHGSITGNLNLYTGYMNGVAAVSPYVGAINIQPGQGYTTAAGTAPNGGDILILAGETKATGVGSLVGSPGTFIIQGGTSSGHYSAGHGSGGDVIIQGGLAASGLAHNLAKVRLIAGNLGDLGANGYITLENLSSSIPTLTNAAFFVVPAAIGDLVGKKVLCIH